jgi:hypothetical protein
MPTPARPDRLGPKVVASSATGIGIAAAADKLGFYGATPVVLHTTTGNVAGFAAGAGTASKSDSVWTGGVGSTAYTVGDVVRALKNLGLMTS